MVTQVCSMTCQHDQINPRNYPRRRMIRKKRQSWWCSKIPSLRSIQARIADKPRNNAWTLAIPENVNLKTNKNAKDFWIGTACVVNREQHINLHKKKQISRERMNESKADLARSFEMSCISTNKLVRRDVLDSFGSGHGCSDLQRRDVAFSGSRNEKNKKALKMWEEQGKSSDSWYCDGDETLTKFGFTRWRTTMFKLQIFHAEQ